MSMDSSSDDYFPEEDEHGEEKKETRGRTKKGVNRGQNNFNASKSINFSKKRVNQNAKGEERSKV